MENIGIIGCGTMGIGIAQVAATAGKKVMLYDQNLDALIYSQEKLTKILERLVVKKKIDEAEKDRILGNISHVQSLKAFKDADLLIEAIIENEKIKKSVFDTLENIVSDNCIIASNTSSLSITSLASTLSLPNRFIGIHFFNPAPLMKLVEIVPALQTDKNIVATVQNEIKSWKKLAVIVKDTPGFIVNKVARPFYGEALRILEEGMADVATIDLAMTQVGGFKMGPFQLMDFIGHDVNYKVTESVFEAFYYDARYRPSITQKQKVLAGYLGVKSGKGFYDYAEGVVKPLGKKDENLLQKIADRIIIMLINEAADTLHMGIASRDDIDQAMATGVNYPLGLLEWADTIGIDVCIQKLDALFDEYHEERYRCSPLLRQMSREGKKFYI